MASLATRLAVWAGLLGARKTDRNIQDSVHVAKGGSEDVGGPTVGARKDSRNLGLSGVVTGLSSSVDEGTDRVVTASALGEQRPNPGAGYNIAGPNALQS